MEFAAGRVEGALRLLPGVVNQRAAVGTEDIPQKTAYEIMPSLVGSEMCIRDSWRAQR